MPASWLLGAQRVPHAVEQKRRLGGQSATRIDDVTSFFYNDLARYLVGSLLRNLVDKRLGFPLRDPPSC